MIVSHASRLLRHATITVTHTIPAADRPEGQYSIYNFMHGSVDADYIVAVGGDGTVNIVVSALMRSGLYTRVPLGVIPYGTGNNLVRSFGLERDSEKALLTIQQGHTIKLDVGFINQKYYC